MRLRALPPRRRYNLWLFTSELLSAAFALERYRLKSGNLNPRKLTDAAEHLALLLADCSVYPNIIFFPHEGTQRAVEELTGLNDPTGFRQAGYLMAQARRLYRMAKVDLTDAKAVARELNERRVLRMIEFLNKVVQWGHVDLQSRRRRNPLVRYAA